MTFHQFKLRSVVFATACALSMSSVMATNGMLMEGYGPISTGMGGASQAFDHGNAAMAQNPATLGLMADGTSRFDVALGILGPDVKSSVMGMPDAKSGGTAYVMPAFGYVKRSGAYTYGFGMFAQGGMGTEYDASSFLASGTGQAARSELGVGNVIFPLAYQVNSGLTIGATLKFLWSSLDMQMAGTVGTLSPIVTGGYGNLAMGFATAPAGTPARVDFSDENKFTGAAKATGWGASVGATYKVNKDLTMGASYQFQSALDDMKTAPSAATMALTGAPVDYGQITVIDFQMPSVFAVGAGWQVSPSLLLAADLKYIGWAESMKDFKMRYDSALGNGSVSFTLWQYWKDQAVLNLGMAWKTNDKMTLRAGLNLADNPVPDSYVHPLFPAIVKNHATLGMGYRFDDKSEFNAALTLAPSVTVTSGQGVDISHAQTSWQFMYSRHF